MRLLALHARGRRAGPIACGLAGVAVACWGLAAVVRDAGMLVPVLGPLAVVSLVGLGLGGDDPALERTTPRRWARWRAAELGVGAAAAAVALLPALVQDDEHVSAALRNLAGLGGLTALGVVLIGARLGWIVPTNAAFAGAAAGPHAGAWLAPVTWPVQAGETGHALVIAAALALTGAVLHLRYGAARANDD